MTLRTENRKTIVVAVASYRRPAQLHQLLPVLLAQVEALAHETRVVVVDNDPGESARTVVESFAGRPIVYAPEPRPGIAAARNRALDEARDADALVFVDDDEEPAPGWLASLVDAWQKWRCAAVVGPVVSRFTGPVDSWVEACSTFRRPRRRTGLVLGSAATNNLLLDIAYLHRFALRFDERFGLTGGEDTMLTRDLVRHGGEIRWCDEAVMTEEVPVNRATRRWALRRTVRTGNVWSRVALTLADSPTKRFSARASLTARGGYRIVRGAGRATVARLVRDVASRATAEIDVATGVGVLLGAYGYTVTEYRRPVSGR